MTGFSINRLRKWAGPFAWRETVVAACTFAWLGLIGIMAGAGANPPAPPITCSILSADVTQPPSCKPRALGGRPLEVLNGAIQLDNGRRLRIVPGWVDGFIDLSTTNGSSLSPSAEITGWAASAVEHRPASAVLLFSERRFVGAIRPVNSRRDVARQFRDPALIRSGYTLDVSLSLLSNGARKTRLQLYAVEGSVASPIALDCTHNPGQFGC